LGEKSGERRQKQKTDSSEFIVKSTSSVPRSADCVKMKKHNLKKQSQFVGGQNNVKSALTMVYGDIGE
jgi:hypothetical protein